MNQVFWVISRLCAVTFLVLAPVTTPSAGVLTKEHERHICTADPDGKRYVDPGKLTQLVLALSLTLREMEQRAVDAAGITDVSGSQRDVLLGRYLIGMRGSLEPDGQSDPGARAATEAIRKHVDSLGGEFFLIWRNGSPVYKISGTEGVPLPSGLFAIPPTVMIECLASTTDTDQSAQAGPQAESGSDTGILGDISTRFRLASTPHELGLLDGDKTRSKNVLKKLKPAEISIRGDIENNSDVFSIVGAAGLQFSMERPESGDSYSDILPYVYYKRQQPGGGASVSKIHVVSPGLQFSRRNYGRSPSYEFSFGTSGVFDLEQDSSQLFLDAALQGSVRLGNNTVLFGGGTCYRIYQHKAGYYIEGARSTCVRFRNRS